MISLLLALSLVIGRSLSKRSEILPYDPTPNPQSVVISGNARFTVLTSSLIRIEWSNTKRWEDRPTLAVLNRNLTVPKFITHKNGGALTITTQALTLLYVEGAPFSEDTLKVVLEGGVTPWTYGDTSATDPGNLLGTIKSLDMLDVISLNCTENANRTVHGESLHCAWGLISKSGWATYDDSKNWVLDENDWFAGKNIDDVDLYFFGSGSDYKTALSDWIQIGGKIAMPPKHVNGIWWSRWYDLNGEDVLDIVKKYEIYGLPLDVFILDMDWHTKEGWGGYSFDQRLFALPETFMEFLHEKGLIIGANIHDDDGVRTTENNYTQFARALGDTSNKTIPFQLCSNEKYGPLLGDIVLNAVEKQGMDFWWIDWQQGGTEGGCAGGNQNPTIWLSKLRGTDRIRRGEKKRAVVLGRWGGMGTHRYQVGFSGDVLHLSWADLAFQPYFSWTGSNVGYGTWSHDLVGPPLDHELHTRWLQWGAHSAIFRTHDRGMANGYCGNSDPPMCAIVEVWNVPQEYFEANRQAMVGRAELLPYIYSASREAFDTGVSLIRPMYYSFPHSSGSYLGDASGKFSQYMFGPDLLVAPIVTPSWSNCSMASKEVFLPAGQWYDKIGGSLLNVKHDTTQTRLYDLSEVPVFVRGGAMIPGVPVRLGNTIGLAGKQYTHLVFTIYPGASSGSVKVYEDDGVTTNYLSGAAQWTEALYTRDSKSLTFSIGSQSPRYSEFPSRRAYTIRVVQTYPPTSIQVNGASLSYKRTGGSMTWRYEPNTLSAVAETQELPTNQQMRVVFNFKAGVDDAALNGISGKIMRVKKAKLALDVTNDTPGSVTVSGGKLQKASSVAEMCDALASKQLNVVVDALDNYKASFQAALNEVWSLKPQDTLHPLLNVTHFWHAYELLNGVK